MTPAQARAIIRDALALCALVAFVAFVAMVLTWSALAAKADDDDDCPGGCKTVTLARLNNYGPYPACEQPSELRLHYLIWAHNYATWLHERVRNHLPEPSDCTTLDAGIEVQIIQKSSDKSCGDTVLVRVPDGYRLPKDDGSGLAFPRVLWVTADAIDAATIRRVPR